MALDPSTQFFDLYQIFVNELIGSVFLAIIFFMIIIWFTAIKLKMPFQLSILFGLLFILIMFAETFIMILYVFVVLIVGGLFYYAVSKIFTQ